MTCPGTLAAPSRPNGYAPADRVLQGVHNDIGRDRHRGAEPAICAHAVCPLSFALTDDLGVGPEQVTADEVGMAYIIQRNSQFYVVAYDGIDPRTNKERRLWHPAGRSRADAEAIAERLTAARDGARERTTSALTVREFLLEQWMPRRHRELRPSTAKRYEWMIDNYIAPAIGSHRLSALRAEHLDRLYVELLDHGGAEGRRLSPKTVYDAHMVIRSALGVAVARHLVDHNVAHDARPPRVSTRSRSTPEVWTASQLAQFLADTAHLRLYPARHLTATTGMRRGEVAGIRWGDWNPLTHRLSIARSRQAIRGGTVEVPTKTAASRRSVDLDAGTERILTTWQRRQARDGHPTGLNDPMFTNTKGDPINPESLTQLFAHGPQQRPPTDPVPRPATHTRLAARRNRRADQGCVGAARPRPPRLHHAQLPARHARHGSRRRDRVRRAAGGREQQRSAASSQRSTHRHR